MPGQLAQSPNSRERTIMDVKSKFPIALLSFRNRYKSDVRIYRLTMIMRPLASVFRICSTLYGHLSFINWLNSLPPSRKHPDYLHLATRQDLWEFLANNELVQDAGFFFEFGVANGDGTKFWLERLGQVEYHGFDCFTGMPEDYRQVPKGVFDMSGAPPPDINDARVTWHIGNVEDTVSAFHFPDSASRIFLFDLDLYHPTKFVLSKIKPTLRKGDVLYFDEAWDDAEGIVARDFFDRSTNTQILSSGTGCVAMIVL